MQSMRDTRRSPTRRRTTLRSARASEHAPARQHGRAVRRRPQAAAAERSFGCSPGESAGDSSGGAYACNEFPDHVKGLVWRSQKGVS